MSPLRQIILRAIKEGSVDALFSSPSRANNVRQKFYRYRNLVRRNTLDPLQIIIDDLSFTLIDQPEGKCKLAIFFKSKDQSLLSKFNMKEEEADDNSRTKGSISKDNLAEWG